MSNDITEAVRRLRGLYEDVERLKAARDQEGEVRLLRLVQDGTSTGDTVSVSTTSATPGDWDTDNWDDTLEWG